ncbi:50S ribosomal protein L6 [Anatilimnocola aggregata]|uniref:Large ribosomal subunit protein uL6 n=1 Tax=Anatilimnocola aggregata TaxID=2528021 RepID=A0A517YJS5_9BACT|nr:50S ribosomal protein L6 [Anatilimnocola aggregata]QDU30462.1 50S ribosomal protein L6 [Anatilimnocola aggregata]
MSRIGNKPIAIIDGVKVSVSGRQVNVEGPKGKLSWEHRPEVSVTVDAGGKQIVVARQNDEREARSFHGLTRALINNMIFGVKNGYEKRLEIIGVGYQATLKGKVLAMRVGYANELQRQVPEGLTVTCPDATHVVIQGADKQKVGQFAAELRQLRKPEPYKGKGVRYQGEQIKLKPGKAASK